MDAVKENIGSEKETKGRELVIIRMFDAPRERVFKAWTDPEQAKRWWGSKNYSAPVFKIDLRVGGSYLYCMRSHEGQDVWGAGEYREIVVPERLVFTDSFADEKGNIVPASHYGTPGDWPLELLVTVTFEDYDGKTKMTLRHDGIPAGEMRNLIADGWNESFEKLAAALK